MSGSRALDVSQRPLEKVVHMKRRLGVATAIAVLAATTLTTATAGADTTPTQEQYRTEIAAYIQDMQGALTAASQNSVVGPAIQPQLSDLQSQLADAASQVPQLTGPELDAFAQVLGQGQAWQQEPAALQQELTNPTLKAPAIKVPAGFWSDCTESLGDPRGLFYAYWAAADVAAIANAVASGAPDGIEYAALTIISAAIYEVANAAAIDLQEALNLSLDCSTAVTNATIASTFATDPSSTAPGNITPTSSQISVDQLAALANAIQTTLDTIQTDINQITTKLTTAINLVGVGQGVANTIQTISTDLQGRTDTLLNNVGTSLDHANDPGGVPPSGTANGLANTINTREDTTLANTATFQALSVRLEIESSLAGNTQPIALFAIPASHGGYLETVQSIVTTLTNEEIAAGQGVGQAQADLASGNAALAAHQYETAYLDYAAAYVQATK
jgi:hypothetical protein